ncbi:MAG: hypothetical protein F9K10_05060, partial [Paludibacter sp.]
MKKKLIVSGIYRTMEKHLLKMKLTLTLLIVCLASFGASTYSQNRGVEVIRNGGNIAELFKQLEETSGYYFFYQKEDLRQLKDVSVNTENASVTEILDKILEGSPLRYDIVDRYIIIRRADKFSTPLEALQQPRSVSGTITDSSGLPLPGVSIAIKGTTQGTISDAKGAFTLTGVPVNTVLVFSFVGMKTQELEFSGQASMDIVMEEEALGID